MQKQSSLRAAFSSLTLSLTSLVLVGAGMAEAANPTAPPTVGGELAAAGSTVTVTSHGNVPALVVMEAESVALSQTEFLLQPEESHSLTFKGKATGRVSATYHAQVAGQETASATLSLDLVPKVPGPEIPFGPIVTIMLIVAAIVLITRRLHPWTWRVMDTAPSQPKAMPGVADKKPPRRKVE